MTEDWNNLKLPYIKNFNEIFKIKYSVIRKKFKRDILQSLKTLLSQGKVTEHLASINNSNLDTTLQSKTSCKTFSSDLQH